MVENVVDVDRLETVVDADLERSAGGNAVDGFEEGGRVWREDPDPLVAFGLDVVGEAAGAVGEFLVGAAEDLAVGCEMDYGFSLEGEEC